jgi:serine/threonine protein kinase
VLLRRTPIQRNPHKNLATYYGCQVSNGRITGLCFQKYRGTLLEMVNPDHLNKSMFIRSESRAAVRKEAAHYLRGIEAGIRHLYHLGRIHNDINPANIMISEQCHGDKAR